jgi:hypothetical protein
LRRAKIFGTTNPNSAIRNPQSVAAEPRCASAVRSSYQINVKDLRAMQPKPAIRGRARWLPVMFAWVLAASTAPGQERAHPLQPPDRSSPRATLKMFLGSIDAVATFVAQEYLPSPTLGEFSRIPSLIQTAYECLDLSAVAPFARGKTGRAAGVHLYERLNRIDLPAWDEIPGAEQADPSADAKLARWVIPHTEITLVRAQGGAAGDEFLFSADTVTRASAFYERVRGLPYTRPVPMEGMSELLTEGGGWPIRFSCIQAMPPWLRARPAGRQFALEVDRTGAPARPLLDPLAFDLPFVAAGRP